MQARIASTRLPGKALIEIEGKPILQRLYERMKLCRYADKVIVATSDEAQDGEIAEACEEWSIPFFRGPQKDLTKRLLGAAQEYGLGSFVRVTADNPLTDPHGIDALIQMLHATDSGEERKEVLVHNVHRKGYPYGTGAEAANCSLLNLCNQKLAIPEHREYFASYVKGHPQQFSCIKMDAPQCLCRPGYFLTIDYKEDLELLRRIYANFGGNDALSLQDVVRFLDTNPELAASNAHLHQQLP